MTTNAKNDRDKVKALALAEYKNHGDLTTQAIADKYGVCMSTLSVWASKAGFRLRQRGRRKLEEPTPRQKEILRQCAVATYSAVGRKFGMQKQAIHRIAKRWKNWLQPKRPPFEPGDVIRWRGRDFTILDAGINSGNVRDDKNRILREFPWSYRGVMVKKVGQVKLA